MSENYMPPERRKNILDMGIRRLVMGDMKAKWCTHCNHFVQDDGYHETFTCPYVALQSAEHDLAMAQGREDALIERAERVQEGEDWDLVEYILRKRDVLLERSGT
jgi:hypothetical protein